MDWIRSLFGKRRASASATYKGYAAWAQNYPPVAHNPFMEMEEKAMLSLFPDLTGKTCLDLACGSGRYLRHMHDRGAARLVGLDVSEAMLARARQLDIEAEWVRGDFHHLPFEAGHFDFICCGLGLGHEPELRSALGEAGRILRQGGMLVYSDMHPLGTLAGWQRTCPNRAGKIVRLPQHLHLYGDHQRACDEAGLRISAVHEPLGGKQVPPAYRKFPVALVIQAVKQGSSLSGCDP